MYFKKFLQIYLHTLGVRDNELSIALGFSDEYDYHRYFASWGREPIPENLKKQAIQKAKKISNYSSLIKYRFPDWKCCSLEEINSILGTNPYMTNTIEGLCYEIKNVLYKAGIYAFGQLVDLTDENIYSLKGVGKRKAANSIKFRNECLKLISDYEDQVEEYIKKGWMR